MREIKFRAFSDKSGMWDWDKLTTFRGGHPLTCLYSHDGWQVMQFTGCKDTSGTEIYEGDILRMFTFDHPVSVEFNCLGHICAVTENGQVSLLTTDIQRCEVIGNIHETPELLNQGTTDTAPTPHSPCP